MSGTKGKPMFAMPRVQIMSRPEKRAVIFQVDGLPSISDSGQLMFALVALEAGIREYYHRTFPSHVQKGWGSSKIAAEAKKQFGMREDFAFFGDEIGEGGNERH